MEVIKTHSSCKEPGVEVVRRTDFIKEINGLLDPRYQLCIRSLSKVMEIFSASNQHRKLTINAPSRNKYILANAADDVKQFIIGRQRDIPQWRARAIARSKRSAAAFKTAGSRINSSELDIEDVEVMPRVSTEAAMEVNRIIDGRPSKLAALYAEAILKAPNSHPVLRLGADNYVALYESPRLS